MKKSNEKFLEFNGKAVSFLNVDGNWWVAIKPICEVLGVAFNKQFERIKNDQILSQLYTEQDIVAADGRLRKMLCLPEKYIYGWLFSIRSEAEGLVEFKKECYDVLFNHFHGGFRNKVVSEMVMNNLEKRKLEEQLQAEIGNNPKFLKIKALEADSIRLGKVKAQLEKQEREGLMDMFNNEN